MKPTDEQANALRLFGDGGSLVIEAGAGTGKTSTLELLARATNRRGQYLAFNKAIVTEASSRFPTTVACSTAHSLAFRAVGRRYAHRLRTSARMRAQEIASRLDVNGLEVGYGGERKLLAAGYLAGHVMRAIARFCMSADLEPSREHFPYIDGIDAPDPTTGRRRFDNNDHVARELLPALRKAWEDLQNPDGALPYKHDHYLKAWHLQGPKIPAEFILFDEAQDANPVLAAIVAAQTHAQHVYVGDTQQQIYAWRGAINALASIDADRRAFLTQSFRFGPAIADAANRILDMLDADLRLRGTPSIGSRLEPLARPRAVLCRTNARAISRVMTAQMIRIPTHLVGGGGEIASFCRAAAELQATGRTQHPELACFAGWLEVQDYVASDPQGSELRMMVDLIDEYGTAMILRALEGCPTEAKAELVVSTAHKAKGREWPTVQLAGDFPALAEAGEDELRLAYVAITRAREILDDGGLLAPSAPPEPPAAAIPSLEAPEPAGASSEPHAAGGAAGAEGWGSRWQETFRKAATRP